MIDWVQWPAMAVTIFAAWFTGSTQARRRIIGFWCFILSNALWVIWGWHDHAYALIALEVALGAMNLRGFKKNLGMRQDGVKEASRR
ncbi:hypothetical protein [Pseudomonas eucalypticola]|uniref:Amino acid transporter n=1 Tax=Pseudomonas eucalypticola TaxID=2599595 RepID=A0A7D5H5B5_9PSED|nr:hypothetical protein [Pseudomonas eucalypticola]QKZ04183.1 hypothetical protein HWQ56_10475 [Pseudomonas eucalypticola]